MELLIAREISKLYGMRPVLRGASLTLQAGDFAALLGANGAGKTTLIRTLATLMRPDRGEIHICQTDALAQPDRARRFIGAVLHQPMLYPDLSARENLEFHARLHQLPAEHFGRIESLLAEVELSKRARDRVRTFSRGMQQRLTIARVLLHQPKVLLLDEPFTGLDQHSADILSNLLNRHAQSGAAILMATHELGRGMDGVTRRIVMEDGKVTG
ncbi:MAG: heme ABC exporter ATP-binding protein CcmA [Anaerolineae bacterium]|nr:heme ABC exporter ATP-binding protein CcmA [Anaerolineae bacterium]